MMSPWKQPVWVAVLLVGTSMVSAEEGLKVWVVPSTRRVLRSDAPGATKDAIVCAARNEWESFQIVFRSAEPARIEHIQISTLSHPAVARAPMPMPEAVRFYRQHQLHITKGTYRSEAFKADWYSDALVRLSGRPGDTPAPGARFAALPVDLPANETHAFWVDVYVPESMRPGEHRRWIWIQTKDGRLNTLGVTLRVWDFRLPKLATLKTQFGSPAARIRSWYRAEVKAGREKAVPDEDALHEQAARLLTEHRFNSAIPPKLLAHKVEPDGSFDLAPEQIAGLKAFAAKFHVNAIPVPRPASRFGDPVKDRDRIVRWLKSWDRNLDAAGLGDRLCYTYLIDEPNDAKAYQHTRQWGRLIRESGARVKVLVTEQTWTQSKEWGTLEGSVDIWVPLFCLFEPKSAAKRQALGESIWTYTALCQGKKPTPWWHTDFPLIHYRVPAWMAWRYGMTGLLYWGGMAYWDQTADPWTDPWTYGKTRTRDGYQDKGRVYNGEGSLLYPGRDVGLVGAVPSVRLKALRDAIEDFEYLAILDRLGKREEAMKVVSQVASSWTDWTSDPEAIPRARQALAALILKPTLDKP